MFHDSCWDTSVSSLSISTVQSQLTVDPAYESLLTDYSLALPPFPLYLRKALQEVLPEFLRILEQVGQSLDTSRDARTWRAAAALTDSCGVRQPTARRRSRYTAGTLVSAMKERLSVSTTELRSKSFPSWGCREGACYDLQAPPPPSRPGVQKDGGEWPRQVRQAAGPGISHTEDLVTGLTLFLELRKPPVDS